MGMKKLIYIGMFVGSAAGGYLPALWGASVFSGISLLLGFIGAILGIFGGYKLAQMTGLQ